MEKQQEMKQQSQSQMDSNGALPSQPQVQKSKRRTKNESTSDRNYTCGCGKAYLSYPALYLHLKNKHNGKTPEGTQLPNSSNKGTRGRPKKDDVIEKGKDDSKDSEDEALEELINFLTSLNKNLTLPIENRRQLHIKEAQMDVLEAFPQSFFHNKDEYEGVLSKLEKLFEQQELEARLREQMEDQLPDPENEDQLLQDPNIVMNDTLDQESNKKDMQLEEQQSDEKANEQQWSQQGNEQSSNNKALSNSHAEEQKNQQNLNEKVDKHIDNLMEIKDVNCNQIFAVFLQKIARCVTNECFQEIAYFICLYRNALNAFGWNYLEKIKPQDSEKIKQSAEQKEEFCEKNTGEFSLEICNEFIIDYLPTQLENCSYKDFKILGLTNTNMKNAVYLTQYLSNWLFFNKYTNSKLLISNNEENQKSNTNNNSNNNNYTSVNPTATPVAPPNNSSIHNNINNNVDSFSNGVINDDNIYNSGNSNSQNNNIINNNNNSNTNLN